MANGFTVTCNVCGNTAQFTRHVSPMVFHRIASDNEKLKMSESRGRYDSKERNIECTCGNKVTENY